MILIIIVKIMLKCNYKIIIHQQNRLQDIQMVVYGLDDIYHLHLIRLVTNFFYLDKQYEISEHKYLDSFERHTVLIR